MKKYVNLKYVLDRLFAFTMLLITSPIMAIAILFILREDSKASPIYKTERVGKDNKVFYVYKLRSMIATKEINGMKLSDAERMLTVGKFLRKTSIDELPQLINILKGEMSFIGPRPLPKVYLPYYNVEELRRHKLKPGISGWAQVRGRNNLNWEDKFKLDLEYVNKVSLMFDLKIFYLTLIKVFKHSDVVTRGDGQEVDFHTYRTEQNEELVITGKD
ncbi:sugar transferase [Sporosarcina sp. G11-34]|uniref:sugar transferase n=1 Tax=Sporosarcina sp. G11-34 TaxID=2849605 RepID=UPI0022A966AA|nr:sugar transferase [Sporosarcina sp. G11-34]MCZ2258626.1 sugar transferase [Sporosarcina sp. G11-34]